MCMEGEREGEREKERKSTLVICLRVRIVGSVKGGYKVV